MDRPSQESLLKEEWEKPSDKLEAQYDYFRKSFNSYSGYQADESNDFESISLLDNAEQRQRMSTAPNWFRQTKSHYILSAGRWEDEYYFALICCGTAMGLIFLLHHYDRQEVPELAWGLQLDTVIIALVTVVRVALGAIVESSISQGAWIWVSEASQKRSDHHARLDDFKLFDEASRGLWGSICLIWHEIQAHGMYRSRHCSPCPWI